MPTQPTQKLNPKIKTVWRISALIVTLICVLPCWGIGALICLDQAPEAMDTLCLVFGIILAVLLAFFCLFMPTLRFLQWSYEIGVHHLELRHGIFWRTQLLVPFIRVQDTNINQGPLMRAFGLSAVTVSTAAGSHTIPGIDADKAVQVREAIAEQARLAREEL